MFVGLDILRRGVERKNEISKMAGKKTNERFNDLCQKDF